MKTTSIYYNSKTNKFILIGVNQDNEIVAELEDKMLGNIIDEEFMMLTLAIGEAQLIGYL